MWALIVITIISGIITDGYELRQRFGSKRDCNIMAESVNSHDVQTLCLPVLPNGEFEYPNKKS